MEKVLKFDETLKTGQVIELQAVVQTSPECHCVDGGEMAEVLKKITTRIKAEIFSQTLEISVKDAYNLFLGGFRKKEIYKVTYESGKIVCFIADTDKAARKYRKEYGKKFLLERKNGAGGWVPIIKNGRRIRYNEFITPADDMRKVLLWGSVVITPFVILITRLLNLI